MAKHTALQELLAKRITDHQEAIRHWYIAHAQKTPPPFYCSVDLRDAGYKIGPVDSNLYPAGFNNICPEDQRTAPALLREQVEGWGRKVLILPEAHTQNKYYLENLYYLSQLFENAGLEVVIGWPPSESGLPSPGELESETGKKIRPRSIDIRDGLMSAGDFIPDWILLNNDFSSGYPTFLDQVQQPIHPSHRLGWHTRKKSTHFVHYNRLAEEFGQLIGIDPWCIQVDTTEITPVNFNEDVGLDRVISAVDQGLSRIKTNYEAHQVKHDPFVFVKNNAGTYGMGIMVAHSGEELRQMNRRTKNKMSVGKNRLPIDSVVVQEGIPTATFVDRLAAEPVIYLLGCELIGGFLRTNTEKGTEDNLNSQGMVFRKLCMSDLRDPDGDGQPLPVLELVYGTIARISALAAGLESQVAS